MNNRKILKILTLSSCLFLGITNAQITSNILPDYNGDDDISSWSRDNSARVGSPSGAVGKAFKFELNYTNYLRNPSWKISSPVILDSNNTNTVSFKSRVTQMPITTSGECSRLTSIIRFFDSTNIQIGSSIFDYYDVSELGAWVNINTDEYNLPYNTSEIELRILPDASDTLDCKNVFAYFDQVELLLTETSLPQPPVCTVNVNTCELEAQAAEGEFIGECVSECSGENPPSHCPVDYLNGKTDILVHCENRAETYDVYDEAYDQCIHACD